MSGGRFEGTQWQIGEIAEQIESVIRKNNKIKSEEDMYPWEDLKEEICYSNYPNNIIKEFKKAVKALKIAYVYAHRVDYLLSGDDGNESFLERLKEELDGLQ